MSPSANQSSILHLVLVTPEIPANTGNVVRLCAATGVHLHLIEPLGFRLDDRICKRAGLDYWQDCRRDIHLTFETFSQAFPETRSFFLTKRAERSFFAEAFQPGDALVLGPESSGLSPRFLEQHDRHQRSLRLPMPGKGRSLNLSNSAAIVVYEALRQLGRMEDGHA